MVRIAICDDEKEAVTLHGTVQISSLVFVLLLFVVMSGIGFTWA